MGPQYHQVLPFAFTICFAICYYRLLLPFAFTICYYHLLLPCAITMCSYRLVCIVMSIPGEKLRAGLASRSGVEESETKPEAKHTPRWAPTPSSVTICYYHLLLPFAITICYYHVPFTMRYYHVLLPSAISMCRLPCAGTMWRFALS